MGRRRRRRGNRPGKAGPPPDRGRVELLYQRKGDYLFGALYVIDGSKKSTPTSGVFHIAKTVADEERVFGSIVNDLRRVWDVLKRYEDRQNAVADQAAQLVGHKGSLLERHVGPAGLVVEFPEQAKSPEIDRFLDERERDTEDVLVLCSVHLRSILELFGGKIGARLPAYDSADNEIATIKMKRLMDTVLHHRYFVLTGEYIVNLQSDKDQLATSSKLGYRVRVFDVLDAIQSTVRQISINNVIGVLRSRLERLSYRSTLGDIVFVVQNIHALSRIVEDRMTDPRNGPFLDFLLDDAAQALTTRIANSYDKRVSRQPKRVDLALPFRRPSFKLVGDIGRKEIEVSCWIDGKTWKKQILYVELFKMISEMYGNDPVLVPKRSLFSERKDAVRSGSGVGG